MSAFWFFYIVSAAILLSIAAYDIWFAIVRMGETVQLIPIASLVLLACIPYANAAVALIFVVYWVIYNKATHRDWHDQ